MLIDLEAIRARRSDGWGYVREGVDTIGDAIACLQLAATDADALLAEVAQLTADCAGFLKIAAEMRLRAHVAEVEVERLTRWIPTSEGWPEAKTWYVGMILGRDRNFTTNKLVATVRMVRGYPKDTPPRDLFPEMTHWKPLEPPT